MTVYALTEVYYDGSHTFRNLIDIFHNRKTAIDEAAKLLTDYYDYRASNEWAVEHLWNDEKVIIYFESEATSYEVDIKRIK